MARKIGLLANGGRSFEDGAGTYNDVLGRNMTKEEMRTFAAPPPDPNNPEDLELILNNMVFRRLNDPNRFDDQRSRYGDNDEMLRMYRFTLDPDESKAIAMELAKKTGVTSDSPEFEKYRNIIYDQSLMIGGKQDKERRKLFGLFAEGGKTFGSKGAGTYISPLDMIKNKAVNTGGMGGISGKARDLALDRLKGAAQFSGLDKDNPFKYAPGVFGGLGIASGLGLFGDEEAPQNRESNFVYDPSQNTLDDIQSGFFQQAQDFDYLPNVPGGIEDYLRKIGLLANGGRSFEDGAGTYNDVLGRNMTKEEMRTFAAPPPDPNNPEDLELILNNMVFRRLNDPNRFDDQRSRYGDNDEMLRMYRFTLDPDESKAIAMELAKKTGVTSDSPEFEKYRNIIYDQSLMIGGKQDKERRKLFGLFAEGGIAQLVDPNLVGGDRINPTGGRIVGMGAGREDLLEGEIVDPNSGQTQEIRVSNNEHVIPEYALFAMGGGDTEKGQQMMDNLREKTKPMAEQMGYDFQGAEDGSMNYAPIMAQDGTQTRGPSMDMRKMIQKLMSQGKSIEEIMAIIQRLSSGSQTKQQQMPMIAADGMETNGLEKMSENMQDGSMTADPMMMAGLGSVVKGLEDAQQMSRMIR